MLLHPAVPLSSLLWLVVQHGQARHSWRRIAFSSSKSSAPLGTSTQCRQSDRPKYSQTPWGQGTQLGLFVGHSCTKEILALLLGDSIVGKMGWKRKSWCVWQAHHVSSLMYTPSFSLSKLVAFVEATDHLPLSTCGSQPQATTSWEVIILLWVVTPWLPEKRANTHGQGTLQESPGFACQFCLH